ncbi:MAG: adenylate/guanylate cyclase domain-containing protein [Zoogloeaceae bacterium]|jgi:adenylate cyclase|nr:adenylate/guanylate cyclase domain-containing protein [Zoogloeaceae bacterium]
MNRFASLRRLPQAAWFSTLLLGVAITLGMMALYVAQPALICRLDLKVYDMLLPLRSAPAPSPVPVIIDLDDASLAAYGQFPWPRYRMADLVDKLRQYQVAAIGMDLLFVEPDRASPEEMRQALQRDKSVTLEFKGLPPELHDYDQALARAVQEAPVVLGAYARFATEDGATLPETDAATPELPTLARVIERARPGAPPFTRHLPVARQILLPLPVLRDKAPIGLINAAPDSDGIVRQMPLLIQTRDAVYPALALQTLMLSMGKRNLIAQSGPDGLESIRIGSLVVPVSPQGSLHIPFIGPGRTYPYISAREVLQQTALPEALAGKIVFVGTSAPGLLDIRATPLDSAYPGVEIHAAILDALLSQNAIRVPPWSPGLQLLAILSAGLIATLVFGFARPGIYLPIAVALLAATFLGARHFFVQGLFVSPLYISMTIVLLGSLLLFLRFWQEEKQKLVLRNAFSHYVSPEIVKRITRLRGDLFAGEERELSILFTDIRDFTTLSETLSPPQIVKLLNRYFTPMTALVREQDGTLDKFIGDALMAFWNAPLDVDRHPARAIQTAMSMQEKLRAVNDELLAEFGVKIRMGAGIHTGPTYVGNMGSADLVNYTLIGDSVNLAARLEGLCPRYGVPIVVSEHTRNAAQDAFAFQYLDTVTVKGKTQAVRVYLPLRFEEAAARAQELADWQAASAFWQADNFEQAATAFAALEARFPQQKLYALYAERAHLRLETN